MTQSYVLLDKKNRKDFTSVFPEVIPDEGNRISLGAYREDGAVLGAVSYVLINYRYDIDWIYVTPAARLQGVGMGLFHEITGIISGTMERYPLCAQFPLSEEDPCLHRFFLSCPGVDVSYSHERYFVTAEDLKAIKPLQRKSESRFRSAGFFDEPLQWQKRTLAMLSRSEQFSVADYEAWKNECAPELCKCLMIQNNLVSLLFVQKDKKDLELSWLYSDYPPGLQTLLADAVADANRFYPKASLSFEAINEKSDQLARHLFPEARHTAIYEAWW